MIVHRTIAHAAEMSESQGVNVAALYRDGFVDHIVQECPDAAAEPKDFCARMGTAIEYELATITASDAGERRRARARKYRVPRP